MKQSILDRIKRLGGDISNVKGTSLQEDLQAIVFDTVLYPKRTDTPWAEAEDQEPIYGISDFINTHRGMIEADKEAFYQMLTDNFYKITKEGHGQVFFEHTLFTPFKVGTEDHQEWDGEWKEQDFRKEIAGTDMDLMIIGYSYGFPDHLFVCLTDPNPENPAVYGTDHEEYFDKISKEGTLESFFDEFMTKEELVEIVKQKLGH